MNRRESNIWQAFVREDPEFFIATELEEHGAGGDFDLSGRQTAARLLEEARPFLSSRYAIALDFGCGIGRPALPMGEKFDEVHGVNVSPTMLERLRRRAAERRVDNISTYLTEQTWGCPRRSGFLICLSVARPRC